MLFRKNIDPSCLYCKHGTPISEEEIACVKKGVVPSMDHCWRFSYDPLKRVPPRPVQLDTYRLTEEDFSL